MGSGMSNPRKEIQFNASYIGRYLGINNHLALFSPRTEVRIPHSHGTTFGPILEFKVGTGRTALGCPPRYDYLIGGEPFKGRVRRRGIAVAILCMYNTF